MNEEMNNNTNCNYFLAQLFLAKAQRRKETKNLIGLFRMYN